MLKICRFCLCREEDSLMSLADLIDSAPTTQDVMAYTGIQINANQLGSYVVCLACTKSLNSFATFRNNCLHNDSFFRELWLAASVPEKQDKNVESIEMLKSEEGAMHFDDDEHPARELENCIQTEFVTNNVCQEISIVADNTQDSKQKLCSVANICSPTAKDTEEGDDCYSANYIQPSDKLFTANVYYGDSTSNWSCYYWPPTRPKVPWQREPGKRKFHLCDVCGIMVGHLPTHALIHKQQPTHACPHCAVKMKQKSGIVQHIQTVHLKVVSKTCHMCGKNFVHRKTYAYHMRAHKDAGESFECKVCSKTFFRSVGLEAHVRKFHSIAKSV